VHPELFQVGFFHVRSYGLMLAIAFLLGTWMALREARRLQLDEDRVLSIVLVVLAASILGARALYVMEHVQEFRHEWTSALALWQGGLTLYGGVFVGIAAGLYAAQHWRQPMWRVADAITPAVALGNVLGRIGCFLNGCCYGKPTKLPWGVVFPPDSFAGLEYGALPVHPSQLYFAAANLVLFGVVWFLRGRLRTNGVLLWTYMALFGLVRIPLDATRSYEPESVVLSLGGFDVHESQLASLALALFALLMILRLRRARGRM
jgi:phosphatidylglycerol:prolipoprotein diacylglycerol transferase